MIKRNYFIKVEIKPRYWDEKAIIGIAVSGAIATQFYQQQAITYTPAHMPKEQWKGLGKRKMKRQEL